MYDIINEINTPTITNLVLCDNYYYIGIVSKFQLSLIVYYPRVHLVIVLNSSNYNNKYYYNIIQNTDPPAYEMTVKVRILQKRLLEQCTRVFDKDLQVQELKTRYEKLKDEFVKLPGRDIFKEMNNIKRNLMKKEDKMKVKLW